MPKATAAERSVTMPNLRIKKLVDQVLDRLPKPHTEEVVQDVFVAIEGDPVWRASYDRMVYESGKSAVTTWAGFWIAHAVKRTGDQREAAARSTLIESYSPLVTAAEDRKKKMKEPEALKAMHDHFLAHRSELPPEIRDYRPTILALIMDGIDTEKAFGQALARPAFAW
jgi:hypothetical protein